jgi:hypothetical protein
MGKLFVTLFAFAPAPQTNSQWPLNPDTRICPQLNSCTLTNFWLRDSLYRDTAPVPSPNFVTGDRFAAPINLVPRHSYNSQNLYLDGKKCAIPSLHRDSFSAKVPGFCPDAASGNTTSLYCRAVMLKCQAVTRLIRLTSNT